MSTEEIQIAADAAAYESTKGDAIGGAKALAVRHFLVGLISLAGSTYLIRTLGAENWAAYAVAYYFVVFFDQNLSVSLIGQLVRSPDPPERRHLDSAAWLMQRTGLGLFVGFLVVSVPAGLLYGRDDLTYTLLGVAVCAYIYALRTVSVSLIERKLDYRSIAIADILDQLTFYALAATLVLSGAGIGGVAVALGLRGALAAVFLRRRMPTPWRGKRDRAALREILSFGGPSLAMAVVLLLNGLVPVVALGGANARELAFTLTTGTIVGYLVLFQAVVQRVGFPTLASLQRDPVRFKWGLERMLGLTNTVVVLGMLPVAGAAPIWLPILFGDDWSDAGIVAALMAAGLLFGTLSGLLSSALGSLGRARDTFVLWAAMTAVYLVAALGLVRVSVLLGVAIAFALSRLTGAVHAVFLLRQAGHSIRWIRGLLLLCAASAVSVGTALLFDDDKPVAAVLLCGSTMLVIGAFRRADLKLLIGSGRGVAAGPGSERA